MYIKYRYLQTFYKQLQISNQSDKPPEVPISSENTSLRSKVVVPSI